MSLVDLGKRLLEAAKRGETEEVRTLMSNGAPFTTDWLGTSPLHFSAQYGHYNTAEVLLRAGISRDARTKVDRTPLHVASQEGHVEIVNLLLQHSADIDARDMLKMTPLHWATEKGHIQVIEILLKAGADVTCENKFDRTALDIALINGRPDIVQIIQLAQQNVIPGLSEPTETVTVETSEIPTEETVIDDAGTITIGPGTVSPEEGDTSELMIQNIQSLKTGEKEDSSDGSSTSVLATLAALAEATAPNNTTNTSTADAMNWLESQGITMISTSDGNIITSAVESGQTITLTEAGKIALNIISQQNLEGEVTEDTESEAPKSQGANNVITIVTKGSGDTEGGILTIPVSETISTGGEGDIIVERVPDEDNDDEPPLKIIKTDDDSELYIDNLLQNKDTETMDPDDSSNQESLRKELEEFKRQAEKYKEELMKKDKDLEEYKKQLSQISEKSAIDGVPVDGSAIDGVESSGAS